MIAFILLCGILVLWLLGSFCFPSRSLRVINKGNTMPVPYRTETLIKTETPKVEQPHRDATGKCVVCGYDRDSHGWECIAYFMNLALESHKDNMKMMENCLKDIMIGKQISILRAEIILQSIDYHKELLKSIGTL